MKEEKAIPANKDIDALAADYLKAQAEADLAYAEAGLLREQLTALVEEHGSVPRRATKSKRIEGDVYQVTLSKGHSVEVNTPRVQVFHAWLKSNMLSYLFRKLFKREVVFVVREEAQELVNGIADKSKHPERAAKFSSLFHQCLAIKDTSPYLKVEPKKKEEKGKEAAA